MPGSPETPSSRLNCGFLQSTSTSSTLQSFSLARLKLRLTLVNVLPSPASAEATISRLPRGLSTDPVSAAQTQRGRWIYGLLIGVFAILIRVINPAYPEGMMLAILLINVFAATIDHFVVRGNIRRREARYAT